MSDHHEPQVPLASRAARAKALRAALDEKNLIPKDYIENFAHVAENDWKPQNGAHVVAKAWTDPAFRERLLKDATSACAELGYHGPQGEYMAALVDTPTLHHVIVCTLCSCTAWPILGLPPDWYKSFEYRSRVVRESRSLLREMGLDLPESVEIRVVDTTAETRFLVLPVRPAGTEGWSEEKLASLISKNVLIGVALPQVPATA
ncbi:nitrile hydratase [Panacagrimonas perspica]|uniref:nitrile hydratase n=1 Tax=Panacagrimonas perspica TaxID=381431 RepID=A0A4S3K865_9GAMM|nr:nitrile hydratase subunit alpha [Panacagrimonas perspica]TDU26589.1 nitrile hydratase [Panacagrimonas perspica]THD03954.1 nitrile hydratase subunit alpha [Panacagrimonas perspica]